MQHATDVHRHAARDAVSASPDRVVSIERSAAALGVITALDQGARDVGLATVHVGAGRSAVLAVRDALSEWQVAPSSETGF